MRAKHELPPRVADEDSIDFAAATTATLGAPSPSLSRGKSFENSPVSTPSDYRGRRGDEQEVEELIKALDLSKVDLVDGAPPDIDSSLSAISYQNPNSERPPCQSLPELSENNIEDADHASHMDEASKLDGDIVATISKSRVASFSCLNQLKILPGNVPGETPIEELSVGRTEGKQDGHWHRSGSQCQVDSIIADKIEADESKHIGIKTSENDQGSSKRLLGNDSEKMSSAREAFTGRTIGGISFSISAESARNNFYNVDNGDGIMVGIISLVGALVVGGQLNLSTATTSTSMPSLYSGSGQS